jgi:hypothetical protein
VAMQDWHSLCRCPACGSPIDYCQGHGPIGDPHGAFILASHDLGEHEYCHPAGCEEAREIRLNRIPFPGTPEGTPDV